MVQACLRMHVRIEFQKRETARLKHAASDRWPKTKRHKLKRQIPAFFTANSNRLLHPSDEDFSVADSSGARGGAKSIQNFIHPVI